MKKFAQLISLALVAVMCVALLASCAPASDPAKAEKALKDAGYTTVKDTTVKDTTAAYKLLTGKNVNTVLTGTKTDDDKNVQHITIVYFDKAEDAKTAYEKLADESDKEKKDESDWVFAKSGTMVYWGTKTAVKDAR